MSVVSLVGVVSTVPLLAILGIATVTDLRARRVPLWLTGGGIALGLLVAQAEGRGVLYQAVLGLLVGAGLLLPFVLRGGFGTGDALLLGVIGAWQGWVFVLSAALWMAVAGGVLALIARRRGRRDFPYVPAIAIGTVIAILAG